MCSSCNKWKGAFVSLKSRPNRSAEPSHCDIAYFSNQVLWPIGALECPQAFSLSCHSPTRADFFSEVRQCFSISWGDSAHARLGVTSPLAQSFSTVWGECSPPPWLCLALYVLVEGEEGERPVWAYLCLAQRLVETWWPQHTLAGSLFFFHSPDPVSCKRALIPLLCYTAGRGSYLLAFVSSKT